MKIATLATCLLLLGAGCHKPETEEKVEHKSRLGRDGALHLSKEERQALDIQIAPATEGELAAALLRFGRVRARPGEEALVVAPFAGRVPRPPAVQPGATVSAGQPLLDLVPVLGAAERIAVGVQGAELQGQLQGAERELQTREAEAVRARELAQLQIVSAEKLQQAETALLTMRARVQALRQARGVQQSGSGAPMTLRAPVAGIVALVDAPVGIAVSAGSVLARILTPGPRWIDLAVAPDDPTGDANGYEVQAGTRWLPARLIARGVVVEEDGARHDRLELASTEAGAVLPGETVPVRVAAGAARGVLVPEQAVVPGAGGELLFVETAEGVFAPRPARVAARFGGQVRLLSGVQSGDKVVVRGALNLRGEAVRAELSPEE